MQNLQDRGSPVVHLRALPAGVSRQGTAHACRVQCGSLSASWRRNCVASAEKRSVAGRELFLFKNVQNFTCLNLQNAVHPKPPPTLPCCQRREVNVKRSANQDGARLKGAVRPDISSVRCSAALATFPSKSWSSSAVTHLERIQGSGGGRQPQTRRVCEGIMQHVPVWLLVLRPEDAPDLK